MLVYELPVL